VLQYSNCKAQLRIIYARLSEKLPIYSLTTLFGVESSVVPTHKTLRQHSVKIHRKCARKTPWHNNRNLQLKGFGNSELTYFGVYLKAVMLLLVMLLLPYNANISGSGPKCARSMEAPVLTTQCYSHPTERTGHMTYLTVQWLQHRA